MLVVGDVGGTHVRLALVDNGQFVREGRFESQKFRGLKEVLDIFLDRKVERGCFALAGPVKNGKCQLTNLPWEVEAHKLGIKKVVLLNDLEAAGYGLSSLKQRDLVTLNQGVAQPGNRAIVAAGTGLGISGLYWDGKNHHPFATEGGHVDFAPLDPQEQKLWEKVHKQYGHVSVERALQGVREDPVTFTAIYGAAAGNTALALMAVGGIYLAGGVAPKILPQLEKNFMPAFVRKGRFENILKQIPVYVVLNDDLMLLGAANVGGNKAFPANS